MISSCCRYSLLVARAAPAQPPKSLPGNISVETLEVTNHAAIHALAAKLKGEALQLGALRLGLTAEQIEMTARACVEHHDTPEEVIELVVGLQALFDETLAILEEEASPLVQQRNPLGSGRRLG